jgi:hypothetical protein
MQMMKLIEISMNTTVSKRNLVERLQAIVLTPTAYAEMV